jgi:8-oxo-dGTP diphosphatase
MRTTQTAVRHTPEDLLAEEESMPQKLSALTVVAGLMQRHGALLICQRRRDGAFPLKWEFPGGKVEPGEAPEDGLRRELSEELDIDVQVGRELYRTRHEYPGAYTVELIFYHIPAFQGVLRNCAFEQIRWEPPVQLPAFDFLDGDAELITLLSQGTLRLPQSQA